MFDLHPLAIEDSIKFDQRPKLEDYGNFVFIVFYGARRGEHETELIEVHLFVSGSFVITVRHGRCDELSHLCERMTRDQKAGEQFVVYSILDTITDTFFPVLTAIDEEIDELGDAITREPDDRQLNHIMHLKRSLVGMRRVVNPERDLLARGMDQIVQVPGLEADTRNYFRDVYDHLIRISEQIDSYRDLLTGTMDVYLSVTSNRLNQVIEAAHRRGHDLSAAHLRDRLLRPELRLDGQADQHPGGLSHLRSRCQHPDGDGPRALVPAQRLHRRWRRGRPGRVMGV